jgi:hypothetical protein
VTGREDVDWASTVALSYSGSPAGRIRADEIDDRRAWDACPQGAQRYAARRCPVSALEIMELAAQEGARVVHQQQVPAQVGCDQPSEPAIPHVSVVSLRPDRRHRDCFSDFAVTLYLDGSDKVTAVDVVLSSP